MDEINLKEFFNYLKKYILVLIVVLILAMGATFIYSKAMKKTVYQAQTSVIIAKTTSSSSDDETAASVNINDINATLKLVPTYSEIVKSESVLEEAIKNSYSHISVSELKNNLSTESSSDAAMLTIKVRNSDANTAATLANKIVDASTKEMTKAYKSIGLSQVNVASAPSSPYNDTLKRDLIIAALLAIFGVVGFAFIKFYFDNTLKHTSDIEKETGLPAVGLIPESTSKNIAGGEVLVDKYPMSPVSESIKTLRTNLQFSASNKRFKTILVTSPNNSDGKSFIASNLAMSFAQTGKKVLLVDCNLRRGSLYKLFDISNEKGLSDYLGSTARDFDKYTFATKLKNLSVAPCGEYPANPSELLASKKCKDLVKALGEIYEIVIFDGASVNGFADSVIMSNYADETLVVVKDSDTTRDELAETKSALSKVGARVAGIVVNMTEKEKA